MCVAFNVASSASSVKVTEAEDSSGAPAAESATFTSRATSCRVMSAGTRRRWVTSTRTIGAPQAPSGARSSGRTAGLELDDLVRRVLDATVIHREQLAD